MNKTEHGQNLSTVRKTSEKYGFTFNKEKLVVAVDQLQLFGYQMKGKEIMSNIEH